MQCGCLVVDDVRAGPDTVRTGTRSVVTPSAVGEAELVVEEVRGTAILPVVAPCPGSLNPVVGVHVDEADAEGSIGTAIGAVGSTSVTVGNVEASAMGSTGTSPMSLDGVEMPSWTS